jgi:DNA-binding response OmpR family regulator
MSKVARALLIHDQEEPLGELTRILEHLHFEVVRTRSCSDALEALNQESPPSLVFTDVTLPDGTWKDVLRALESSPSVADVILVSRVVDDPLYITALESGAADFVVPPFKESDVAWVVGNAVRNNPRRKPV